ncbi:MAG: flavin reductase [Rhodospirillales bacterium]
MTAIDSAALRKAFGAFPTGVTVVTTVSETGDPVGFTANSFTSVSLDPPMLLVCPGRHMNSFAAFAACERFAVSVLAEGQEDVSNTFARFEGDRFAAARWQPDAAGVPLIEGAAAQFSCRTREIVEAGDHIILLGEIDGFHHSGGRGLGFVQGRYFSLGLEQAAAEAPFHGRRTYAGAIITAGDAVYLMQTPAGWAVPRIQLDPTASVRTALGDWFAADGVPVDLGRTYSVYDGDRGEHFTFFLGTALTGATAGSGTFVPLGDIAGLAFATPAERSMMDRFVTETRTRSFGFYVGDSVTGYVHKMDGDDGTTR